MLPLNCLLVLALSGGKHDQAPAEGLRQDDPHRPRDPVQRLEVSPENAAPRAGVVSFEGALRLQGLGFVYRISSSFYLLSNSSRHTRRYDPNEDYIMQRVNQMLGGAV